MTELFAGLRFCSIYEAAWDAALWEAHMTELLARLRFFCIIYEAAGGTALWQVQMTELLAGPRFCTIYEAAGGTALREAQ